MTIEQQRPRTRVSTWRTDPECPGERHAPEHRSYQTGCRCAGTVAAEQEYQAHAGTRPPQGRRMLLPDVHDNPDCKATTHRPTQDAWSNAGCRCSGAMFAHRTWLERKAAERDEARRLVSEGTCSAATHHSRKAYDRGCRCPGSTAKHEAYMVRRDAHEERKRRDREQAREWDRRAKRTIRLTGGRLNADPRRHWRDGNMAVDRNSLWLLIHGFADRPTMAERIAAAIALAGSTTSGSAWFEKPRLMNYADIGRRLGISEATAKRLLTVERARLAAERTDRRLAEAKWKAAVAAQAAGRKQRVAAEHLITHLRKRAVRVDRACIMPGRRRYWTLSEAQRAMAGRVAGVPGARASIVQCPGRHLHVKLRRPVV